MFQYSSSLIMDSQSMSCCDTQFVDLLCICILMSKILISHIPINENSWHIFYDACRNHGMNSIQLLLDSSSLINYYNLLPSHRHVFPVSAAVGWLKQPMSLRQYIAKGNSRELLSSVMNLDVTAVTGNAALRPLLKIFDCNNKYKCIICIC